MSTASPYVVTDDLSLVFSRNDDSRPVPDQSEVVLASAAVLKSLTGIFPRVDRIEAERISGFLKQCAGRESLPVISLTGLLGPSDTMSSIELSRSVSHSGDQVHRVFDDVGLMSRRCGGLPMKDQFLAAATNAKTVATDVALADDVVFTGGTIGRIIDGLAVHGVRVRKLFASVAIEDGIRALEARGVEVLADHVYETVIDEVCMRDFIVGTPGGGRNVMLPKGVQASAPYLWPFGQVDKWASIESNDAVGHSRLCLEASATLWDRVQNANNGPVRFGDLEKPVIFCQSDEGITEKLQTFLTNGAYRGVSPNPL